jgi:cell division protein FtsW
MSLKNVDKPFLIIVLVLALGGFFMFISASLGLHAREGATFSSVVASQFGGLLLGLLSLWVASRIPVSIYKQYALPIFLFGLLVSLTVFLPGIGMEHGGAHRWIRLGAFTFQPSELLKFGTIVYAAAWFSSVKSKAGTWKEGLLPFLVVVGLTALVLLAQPDTDTFIVTAVSVAAIYIVSGASWKHVGIATVLGLTLIASIVAMRPYVLDRITTFIRPSDDVRGSGYQVNQSLIAIGSGGLLGKGFGQSAQKFKFLPEPIGDSVYAVAAEEFGFFGASAIILAFILFLSRGLHIARRSKDTFGGLLVLGIVIMALTQSFMNIGAMVGVLPLMGIPLLFISHGGSALLIILAEAGIILRVSRDMRERR